MNRPAESRLAAMHRSYHLHAVKSHQITIFTLRAIQFWPYRNQMDPRQERQLVLHFQRSRLLLKADGVWGPKTAAELYCVTKIPEMLEQFSGPLVCAWGLAISKVGLGGVGGNNAGPFIDNMRLFFGWPTVAGSWCGVFASYALCMGGSVEKALASRGARRLVRNMAAAGADVTVRARQPGYDFIGIASYSRGTGWQGHVRFVMRVGGLICYIGGNEQGDVVRWGFLTQEEFERNLIQVATI